MLLASILKLFYWLGAHYDTSLLLQAIIMIGVQLLLLHVALTNRPSAASMLSTPFSAAEPAYQPLPRPYGFWQWRPHRPYWVFLCYFTLALVVLQVVVGVTPRYTELLGYTALAIEATLPLPQIWANQKRRCCKGFRLSVLANWLLGDAFKMVFFFAKGTDSVPWAFKLCGIFQACCDLYLGVQYLWFGNGGYDDVGLGRIGADKGIEMNGWNGK